jgi:hypothetical protein
VPGLPDAVMMVFMRRWLIPMVLVAGTALTGVTATGCGWQGGSPAGSSARAARVLCGEQSAAVADGAYIVQNNEYGSTAPACVSLGAGPDFQVTRSSVAMPVDGGPAGYPSVFQGCHWGNCTSRGLGAAPVKVADLTPGTVSTSWSTTQPTGGAWNAAYDIWFARTPRIAGQPNCAELMVWLNDAGGVYPYGGPVASGVDVGGVSYDVWEGRQHWGGDTITYLMTAGTTSVSGLDVGTLAQDAVSRGYLPQSCYLIDVEAGFELWHDGAGLGTNAFSVTVRR